MINILLEQAGNWMVALILLSAWLLALAACGVDSPVEESTAIVPSVPPTDVLVLPTTAPSATSTPSGTESPLDSRAGTGAESIPVPPDRDYYNLARELIPGVSDVSRVVRESALTLQPAHIETFTFVDLEAIEIYEQDLELRLVTPHAYWFVEGAVEASREDIEKSASEFEEIIYPKLTGAFGEEWSPGVDGDPHLYIISANLRGVGGYFNAADEYPKQIRPVSNEHEAIYINARYLPIGSREFSRVLAHELQHAVHWNHDPTEETWVGEGLSELAVTIAGYDVASTRAFLRAGPTSLTNWPAGDESTAGNYGAASLFMHYLTNHYGGRDDLRPLVQEQADGITGVNAFLATAGHSARFADVFQDWAVANLLDEEFGPFSYPDMDIRVPVYENLRLGNETTITTDQFATEYVRLDQPSATGSLTFQGHTTVPLLPVDVGDGCWWSNKGDVINTTLTTTIDLAGVADPLLSYQVWHSIEEDWDFTYVEVSQDRGDTWTILASPLTSDDNPLNVSFGPGYTGESEGWQDDSLSLEQWSGQEIMVRFQYVTDAAVNDHGLCLRHLRVTTEGGMEIASDWRPKGFTWTDNLVRQSFFVQLIYEGQDAGDNRVQQMTLNYNNRGEISIDPDPKARRIVLAVQPTAPATRMPATYSLSLR